MNVMKEESDFLFEFGLFRIKFDWNIAGLIVFLFALLVPMI